MHGLTWLAGLLGLAPVKASLVGARLAGYPGLASELLDICEVETGCERVGLHAQARPDIRRRPGVVFWRAAHRQGLLTACAAHQLGDAERWGIAGTHGLAAAYSVHLLGECVAPEAVQVPLLSAIVTARRLGELATRYRRRTQAARAHAWRHGVGCRCAQLTKADQ